MQGDVEYGSVFLDSGRRAPACSNSFCFPLECMLLASYAGHLRSVQLRFTLLIYNSYNRFSRQQLHFSAWTEDFILEPHRTRLRFPTLIKASLQPGHVLNRPS